MNAQDLFNAAADRDLAAVVVCDGMVDYRGVNMAKAYDAVEAVEEAEVNFYEDGEHVGWALILIGLDDDEQIADCSGIVERMIEGG